MIKKILCPIDFSDAAINAVSYAAKVAQTFKAELILLNVRATARVGGPGSSKDYADTLQKSEETLNALVKEVNKAYRISCTREVKLTMQDFNEVIGDTAGEDTLIVIGSNGADTISQDIFGSNTYRIVKRAKCPVWLVPEKWEYGTPDNLLFIFSNDGINDELKNARPFLEIFRSDLTFLKIGKSVLTNIDIARLKEDFRKRVPEETHITIDSTTAENIAEKILERAFRGKISLLIICYHRKTFLKICKKDIVRSITKQPFLPMLIFPESE
ncbi:universal stress protein [Aurantibacillus circumpalustris]|uniref:universal stress protein n=1 Tax=Aurantibacillus circumpalustris TaxID=3036359 RepID=UPI00295BE36E|nr:universal stress protein [Aurantibacillus circumpalustris]